MASKGVGPECTFCGDSTGTCPHMLVEVDMWDCEVRRGPLAEAVQEKWTHFAPDYDPEVNPEVSKADLFELALEPVFEVADHYVDKEVDPMPGMSWTIRRYLVKEDRDGAVQRALAIFDGEVPPPARRSASKPRPKKKKAKKRRPAAARSKSGRAGR